jgi:hypothetical protein
MITLLMIAALLVASPASAFYLTWTQDTSKSPVSGFEIQRKVQGKTYVTIGKVGDVRGYQDTDPALNPDTTYCYQVRALSGTTLSSPWSTETCAIYAGVRIFVAAGQTVLVSRRATTGASTVSILVNANQMVSENQPIPDPKAVTINYRPGIQLLVSRRATSGASTISLLVNQNEVVTVNGVKQ